MKAEEIFQVIMKLTGEVHPVGDAAIDNHRYENMRVFLSVFDRMHFVIDNIALRYKDSIYHSEKVIGNIASERLEKLTELSKPA